MLQNPLIISYLPLFMILLLAVLAGLIAIGLGYLFGPRRPTERKSEPYESGMVPFGSAMRKMHVRYYLIAVLFILFDVETIFFLPFAVALRKLGMMALIEMILFVVILAVGFIYAWKKGALEWE
jgi:NADH-quinone oxidoreductase subunit A